MKNLQKFTILLISLFTIIAFFLTSCDITEREQEGTLFLTGVDATSGNFHSLTIDGIPVGTSNATGTVTSVGLTTPSQFSVSGSPVTNSGTLAVTWSPYWGDKKVLGAVQNGDFAGTPQFWTIDSTWLNNFPADVRTMMNNYSPSFGSVNATSLKMSGNLDMQGNNIIGSIYQWGYSKNYFAQFAGGDSSAGSGGLIVVYGNDSPYTFNNGGFQVYTTNSAKNNWKSRIFISGNNDNAIAYWDDVVHQGIKLGGSMNADNYTIQNVVLSNPRFSDNSSIPSNVITPATYVKVKLDDGTYGLIPVFK